MIHIDFIQALCTHQYARPVPLLRNWFTGFAGAEAEAVLSETVGRDLEGSRSGCGTARTTSFVTRSKSK
jgi:hypothetical protein